jgi:hypothetical protein
MLRQVGYGDHLKTVLQAEVYEIRYSRHVAVVVHNLADHA